MSKRHISILLKIAVSTALIYFVFRQVDWQMCGDQMKAAFRQGYGWLIAAVAVTGIVFTVSSWRWKTILRAHDVAVPFLHTFRLLLLGFFFGQFMPGGLAAGDVIRSYYISSCSADKKMECVATVILDRVVGSFGVATVVLVSLLLWGQYLGHWFLLAGIVVIVGIGIVLFFSRRVLTKLPFAEWIYQHLPYRDHVTRAYEAFRHYREHKSRLLLCWGLSVMIQILLVFAAYCVGQSVGITATAFQYLVWVPLVGAIAALPITVGSIGTAEAGYRFFFYLQGNHPEAYGTVVLAFALMMRLLWLFVGAVGGLLWWAERGMSSRKAPGRQQKASEDISQEGDDVFAHSTGERE